MDRFDAIKELERIPMLFILNSDNTKEFSLRGVNGLNEVVLVSNDTLTLRFSDTT